MPSWQKATTASIESAAADQRPLVLYFADEGDSEWVLYGDDFAELSKSDAMFVKFAHRAERDDDPWAAGESKVPVNKLLSDNPHREYDIPVGKNAVVICDWHGNEFYRTDNRVRHDKLKSMVERVSKDVEKATDKLQKNLDRAKAALEKEDTRRTLSYILKNFKEGLVGLEPIEESIRMYHEILDDLRVQKDEMVEKGDTDGLKEIAKIVRKTDMEDEVKEAMDEAKKVAAKN